MQLSTSVQGTGLEFYKGRISLINRTGSTLTPGEVVQVDIMQSSTSTTGTAQGADTSLLAGAVTPYNAGSPYSFYAIVLESAEAGRRFQAQTCGRLTVRVTSAFALGSGDAMLLVRPGSRTLNAEPANFYPPDNSVGFNYTAITATTSQFTEIEFDGLSPIMATSPGARKEIAYQHDIGLTTVAGFGSSATFDATVGTGGAPTVSDSLVGGNAMELITTANTSGDSGGRLTSAGIFRGNTNPVMSCRVATGASILNLGIWIGATDVTLANVDDITTEKVAAFRYNTASTGHTSNVWTCVTNDGTGPATVTATTAAIAVSSTYDLKIAYDATNSAVRFFVGGVLVASHTTTLPAATDLLKLEAVVATKAAATKRLAWSKFNLSHG